MHSARVSRSGSDFPVQSSRMGQASFARKCILRICKGQSVMFTNVNSSLSQWAGALWLFPPSLSSRGRAVGASLWVLCGTGQCRGRDTSTGFCFYLLRLVLPSLARGTLPPPRTRRFVCGVSVTMQKPLENKSSHLPSLPCVKSDVDPAHKSNWRWCFVSTSWSWWAPRA